MKLIQHTQSVAILFCMITALESCAPSMSSQLSALSTKTEKDNQTVQTGMMGGRRAQFESNVKGQEDVLQESFTVIKTKRAEFLKIQSGLKPERKKDPKYAPLEDQFNRNENQLKQLEQKYADVKKWVEEKKSSPSNSDNMEVISKYSELQNSSTSLETSYEILVMDINKLNY